MYEAEGPGARHDPDDRAYEELLEKNRRFLWNPFTQMKGYLESEPVIVERAEGVRLVDVEGRSYYDGNSSMWLNVHGHRKAELDRAISEQLERVAHSTLLGQGNVPALELAERLVGIVPPGSARSSTRTRARRRSRSR